MARRQTKRIDLVPRYMGEEEDYLGADADSLKLEIEIASGTGRAIPFSNDVRNGLATLLNVQISDTVWRQINSITARYIQRANNDREALSTAKVRSACTDMIAALDHLGQTFAKHSADPGIARLFGNCALDTMVEHLTKVERISLETELIKCSHPKYSKSVAPWDIWVRSLARVVPEFGVSPSGEGNDRSGEASDFVKLLLRLQSELPEDLSQHESDHGSDSSLSTFARAVRRALKNPRTINRATLAK
jgi:hypothetical protein